jgi:hypothetical protein
MTFSQSVTGSWSSNQEIALVGGGNSAGRAAVYLASQSAGRRGVAFLFGVIQSVPAPIGADAPLARARPSNRKVLNQ